MIRVWSPSSGSTLMISAPWSPSSMVQNGPASICVRSTIFTPSRAPRISVMWTNESLLAPMTAPLDQDPALALEDVLVVLVHAVMLEAHDAGVGLRRVANLQHLAVTIERIAVIKRALQPDLVHAKFGECVLGGVLGGEPNAHRDGDAAETQPLAVVRALGQVLV